VDSGIAADAAPRDVNQDHNTSLTNPRAGHSHGSVNR
jgi:hypothetical protein